MLDFRQTAEGAALYKAMSKARDALASAHLDYHRAFEASLGTDDAKSVAGLREQGRAYAQAVSQYSTAVMAWLRYVDVRSRDEGKGTSP